MINAGGRAAPEIIRGLAQISDARLTVTVGRDERLRQAVEAVRLETGREFEIVGWSDQLPRLMLESHLLISKAGGATVQETIAAKCPMIISQIVPGQEEGNARLIEETRSGVVATTPEAIIAAVERAFAEDGRLWHEWSANISRLSRPRASFEIAELLLARCQRAGVSRRRARRFSPGRVVLGSCGRRRTVTIADYAAGFWPAFFVQDLRELLQAGHDLRRLGQHGAGQFLGVIRPALRHFREGHHDRKRVVNRVLDLAEFLLQLRDFFLWNGADGLGHDRFKSLEKGTGVLD